MFTLSRGTKSIKYLIIAVFFVCVSFTFVSADTSFLVQGPAKTGKVLPKENINFDDTDSNPIRSEYAGTRGKVPFDHEQHISLRAYDLSKSSCVVCHHTNSKKLTTGIEEEVLRCTVCHKENDSICETEGTNEDKQFKGKNAISFKSAYHGNDSNVGCVGCHKTYDLEGKYGVKLAEGSDGCNNCHNGEATVKYAVKVNGLTFPEAKKADKPEARPATTPKPSPMPVVTVN